MFNLDPGKLLVIAVVAIILLGPDRLPQVARQVGAAWRSFNEFRHRMESEVRSSMPDLPSTSEIARLARSPSALLNHLSAMSENEADENAAPDGEVEGAVTDGGVEGATPDGGVEGATPDGVVDGAAAGPGPEPAGTEAVAGAGAVAGNGAHSPGGENGSTRSPSGETAPLAPVTPPPGPSSPHGAQKAPAPRSPETTVPVDPSLN
jgi:TatA/E family protein of Tat protein translocase